MNTRFVLVDCNNFFVSCERVFRPDLKKKPVVVLSNNDGCVVSRSEEAKMLGIPMGVPFFQIQDFCKNRNVEVFSSNYELYGDLSSRVMQIVMDMSFDMEIYSIDEAFLQYPLSMENQEVLHICKEIQERVYKWVGIPISLGIAPTKTLAKLASKLSKKKGGIFDLQDSAIQQSVLSTFPIEDVWGIGRRSAPMLFSCGIRTAGDFIRKEVGYIRKKMGVQGERIWRELRGYSCLSLEERSPSKSISYLRSFGHIVQDEETLGEALSTYVAQAGVKLREQKRKTSALCVQVEFLVDRSSGKRSFYSTSVSLEAPTHDTSVLISAAKGGLKRIYKEGLFYKKCGVILLDLSEESEVPLDFFRGNPDPKREKLMKLIDEVNAKQGKNTIFYGAMGVQPVWKMKADNRSPRFTTSWSELAIVKS